MRNLQHDQPSEEREVLELRQAPARKEKMNNAETIKGVGLQTAAMIELAGNDVIATTGKHQQTGKHHGCLMLNHPTPSGCERWTMVLTDNRGFDSQQEADAEFRKILSAAGVVLPAQKKAKR